MKGLESARAVVFFAEEEFEAALEVFFDADGKIWLITEMHWQQQHVKLGERFQHKVDSRYNSLFAV